MRGEYLTLFFDTTPMSGSPPLARGILFPVCSLFLLTGITPLARGIQSDLLHDFWILGITPACAGNTSLTYFFCLLLRDHPRLRGEYNKSEVIGFELGGSPPLARGIPICPREIFSCTGITPACAGNTTGACGCTGACGDHPRLRGEYSQKNLSSAPYTGSPPLARGIH